MSSAFLPQKGKALRMQRPDLFPQVSFAGRDVLRHADFDRGVQVAAQAAAAHGQSFTVQAQAGPRLGAGGDFHFQRAFGEGTLTVPPSTASHGVTVTAVTRS